MIPRLRRLGRGGLPRHCRASVARSGVLGLGPARQWAEGLGGPSLWSRRELLLWLPRPITWWRQKADGGVVMHSFISGLGPRIHVQHAASPPASRLLPS